MEKSAGMQDSGLKLLITWAKRRVICCLFGCNERERERRDEALKGVPRGNG